MSELRLGNYRITDTIGTGALATIYRAVQEPMGRIVALKALKTQIAATSSFGDQLDREAKILADLVHPNIVMLLEAGRTQAGRPYVALEHVDGPSLQDLLADSSTTTTARRSSKKRVSVAAALAVAVGVCAALEHVHERGIVHRDIKPGNVLVSKTGVVKLIDFGIAQRPRTTSVSDAEGITMSGRMAPEQLKDAFGTPAYMSPEQILGDFVDGRSDLFSLGVVLYQLLSGARPFESKVEHAKRTAAQRIRQDAPAPLRERSPHVPRAVERIVMRLLEKSPNERYPSATAVKERLESVLRAETREAPSTLIREMLADFGFVKKEAREKARASTQQAPLSTGKVLAGFAGVAMFFAVGATVIESSSAQAREGRGAGARALELVPEHAGGLRVIAIPWAYVRVDGQLVETTPFAKPIPLTPGKHWVTLTHPEATQAIEREITVTAGETTTLDVMLSVSMDDAGAGKDGGR